MGKRPREVVAAARSAVLDLCDGTRTIGEIAEITRRDRSAVYADWFALRNAGHAAPIHRRPRGLNNGGAVYRHFAADGRLLYVGCSVNPLARLSCHVSQAKWFKQIARIDIVHYARGDEAIAAEAEAIRTENPVFNIFRPKAL